MQIDRQARACQAERTRLKRTGHKKNADTNAVVGFKSKAASAPKFKQMIVEVNITSKAESLALLQEQADTTS